MNRAALKSHWRLLRLALFSEACLAILALGWAYFRDLSLPLNPNWTSLAQGLLCMLPPLILNGLLFLHLHSHPQGQPYRRFLDEVIRPLCAQLNVVSALLIAIAAGVAEELLFRGVLDQELLSQLGWPAGIVVSNLIFAYVHFIGQVKTYFRLLFFYLMFGLYFSLLASFFNNLVQVMVCHAAYNFLVILLIRRLLPLPGNKYLHHQDQ